MRTRIRRLLVTVFLTFVVAMVLVTFDRTNVLAYNCVNCNQGVGYYARCIDDCAPGGTNYCTWQCVIIYPPDYLAPQNVHCYGPGSCGTCTCGECC